MREKKADFLAVFSAFYGQRPVTAAWATRSPWSIVSYDLTKTGDKPLKTTHLIHSTLFRLDRQARLLLQICTLLWASRELSNIWLA